MADEVELPSLLEVGHPSTNVELDDIDINDPGSPRLQPLHIKISDEDRDELGEMLLELMHFRRGKAKRAKAEWWNAVITNVLLIVAMSFIVYIGYLNFVQPILRLDRWKEVQDCVYKGYELDFMVSLFTFFPLAVVKVEYSYPGSTQRYLGYATQSVIGSSRSGRSDSDFLTNVISQETFDVCWVDPRNVYRVALYKDETVSATSILLILCLAMLLALQVLALVQTCLTKKAKLCICSRNRDPEEDGYGAIPMTQP